MHIANLPRSAFGLQVHHFDPAKAVRRPSVSASTTSTVGAPPPGGGRYGPVVGSDPARGSELLRRLEYSQLRDTGDRASRPVGEVDHKKIHKALKKALKPMVKLLKKATRELMKEVGANKADRKAVRDLYKEFRTTVRATIKHARKSDIDDLVKVGPRIEEAFDKFVAGLKVVLGETAGHVDRRTEPAAPDASVGDLSASRAPDKDPPGTTIGRPLDTTNETTHDTKSVPSRFEELISELEGMFKEGMGSLMDRISSLMSDPPRHHHGHDDDRDDDRDDDHDHHRRHGDRGGVSGVDTYKRQVSWGSGGRVDRAA